MDYQEFVKHMQQAEHLVKAGKLKDAEDSLYKLFLSEISDIDKINITAGLAEIYDRLGNPAEALAWFDKGIDLEHTYSRYGVTEKKAQYMSTLGRGSEAIAIYEKLMNQPFISESERDRMRKTIQVILGQTMQ